MLLFFSFVEWETSAGTRFQLFHDHDMPQKVCSIKQPLESARNCLLFNYSWRMREKNLKLIWQVVAALEPHLNSLWTNILIVGTSYFGISLVNTRWCSQHQLQPTQRLFIHSSLAILIKIWISSSSGNQSFYKLLPKTASYCPFLDSVKSVCFWQQRICIIYQHQGYMPMK